ncbi:MAG: radical SAM-associated putative lipoprotein [Paludibacteraceae bacterium]|nr:radical SAM-associated putative lipoprotein [Paludibacteraceae bacterium]
MMKNTFRLLNKILAFFLTLLGVQACDPGADEYGCPSADYIFHGKVTDEAGNALSGVRVCALKNYEEYRGIINSMEGYDEIYNDDDFNKRFFDSLSVTKADGSYSVLLRNDCGWNNVYGLHFDNKEGMHTDTLLKDIAIEPFRGGNDWKQGVSDNTLNITLKEK